MEPSLEVVTALAVGAVVVAHLAVALAVRAFVGQRRLRRAYAGVVSTDGDVLAILQRHIDEVAEVRGNVASLEEAVAGVREVARAGLSRVGTVRYDAFDDIAGALSFSTALLDEHGDGVVLTSINGRAETRTYAKPLTGGASRHSLSDEEIAAIRQAMDLAGRTVRGPAADGEGSPATSRPTAGAG